LFLLKLYYKVAPPSERNELNLSLLSSSRSRKLKKMHQMISAGRWRIFARFTVFDREIIWPKSDCFFFSK